MPIAADVVIGRIFQLIKVVVATREQVAGGVSAEISSEEVGSVSRSNPGKTSMPA